MLKYETICIYDVYIGRSKYGRGGGGTINIHMSSLDSDMPTTRAMTGYLIYDL